MLVDGGTGYIGGRFQVHPTSSFQKSESQSSFTAVFGMGITVGAAGCPRRVRISGGKK